MQEYITVSVDGDKAEGSVGLWVMGLIRLLTPEQKEALFQYVQENGERK